MYDLVCIGFGPAQIATAIANNEAQGPANVLFLERKPSFSWHCGSHLSRTRVENAFVYDLATPRNPRSAFSYVNYLLVKDRLIEFANSDRLNPLREEFEDYLKWCAAQFQNQVRYQSEVLSVSPERDSGAVRKWAVEVKDANGSTYTIRTKKVIAPAPSRDSASKPRALTAVNFEAGQRILSLDEYLSKRNELREARESPLEIAIVGSGQQAIEILNDLLTCHNLGNITVVTENESLAPIKALQEEECLPPTPRLCSIWAQSTEQADPSIPEASELVKSVYDRAYEKRLRSKGRHTLRVVIGQDATAAVAQSNLIISETAAARLPESGLFHKIDSLVLGCRRKGESLEEVQFKRGTVAEDCRLWMMSAQSDGGRSLAKDVAQRAGEVVKALAGAEAAQDGAMVINARM